MQVGYVKPIGQCIDNVMEITMLKEEIIRSLIRTRLVMLRINDLIRQKSFAIPLHLGLGHEAIAVALSFAKSEHDSVALTHRNMHYNIAVQKNWKAILDEYSLSVDGVMDGMYGSMNLIQPKHGLVYTSSILGNNLCVAVGLAKGSQVLEKQKSQTQSVTFVVTGDGAMEEGAFYESLLMAKTSKVPMVVLVENNGWSMYTQIHERRCPIDLQALGQSLSVPTFELKSNDVVSYTEQLTAIRSHAIEHSTPVIVEVLLHTLGDYWVEDPKKRIINYHHGLAPKIDQLDQSIIDLENTDPVYVVRKQYSSEEWAGLELEVLSQMNEGAYQ